MLPWEFLAARSTRTRRVKGCYVFGKDGRAFPEVSGSLFTRFSYPLRTRSSMGFVSVCTPLKYFPGDEEARYLILEALSLYPCFLSVVSAFLSLPPSLFLSPSYISSAQHSRVKLRHFDTEVGSPGPPPYQISASARLTT